MDTRLIVVGFLILVLTVLTAAAFRVKERLKSFGVSALCGLATLGLAGFGLSQLGIGLGIHPVSVASAVLLGPAGIIGMLFMRLI